MAHFSVCLVVITAVQHILGEEPSQVPLMAAASAALRLCGVRRAGGPFF